MTQQGIVFRWASAGLTLAALGAGPTVAGDLGRCYSADVPVAFVLPDGVERGPGQVRVCTSAFYTPVTSLHKVYWNGDLVGLFPGRRGETEAEALGIDRTVLVFARLPDKGPLVLDGYARVDGNRALTYALTVRGRVASRWQLARGIDEPSPETSPWILIATANVR